MARGDTYTAASSDVRECGERWWHVSIGHLKKKMTSVFVWKLWQELVHSCLRGPPTQHSPFPRDTQACVCPVSSCPMCHKWCQLSIVWCLACSEFVCNDIVLKNNLYLYNWLHDYSLHCDVYWLVYQPARGSCEWCVMAITETRLESVVIVSCMTCLCCLRKTEKRMWDDSWNVCHTVKHKINAFKNALL